MKHERYDWFGERHHKRLVAGIGIAGSVALLAMAQTPGASLRQQSRTLALHYTLTDLGTLGGDDSYGQAINSLGQIVGSSKTATGENRAFFWADKSMKNLGTLPGLPDSFASKINEAEQVVGMATSGKGDGISHAFLWQSDKMTDLGILPGDNHSSADAINGRGQIAGISGAANQTTHDNKQAICLWKNGAITKLPIDRQQPYVVDMNDDGDVLAASTKEDLLTAFVYRNGKVEELSALGGKSCEPGAINKWGDIVGNAETKQMENHAFLYRGGKMQDLGTLGGHKSEAHGINSAGQIVGRSEIQKDDTNTTHAFLYSNGIMVDLNRLVTTRTKWTLITANAINDRGEIVCDGEADGKTHAILLTPK